MLTVKDNWKDVKVGDRLRVRPNTGGDGFEATVVVKGSQDKYGYVSYAVFKDNVTLKVDGTPRKRSAKERRNQVIHSRALFQIVDSGKPEVSIPKTAGELTDEHVGMKFRFHGNPVIDGTYDGKNSASEDIVCIKVADVTYDQHKHEEGLETLSDRWSNSYYIAKVRQLDYLGGSPKEVDETVDTDAKLAAYFNQELGKWMYKIGSNGEFPETYKLGEEIIKIMKTLTK